MRVISGFFALVLVGFAFEALHNVISKDAVAAAPFDRLSPHELPVAVLAARGCSNSEIGEHLYVSVNTIKSHLHRALLALRKKMGVPS